MQNLPQLSESLTDELKGMETNSTGLQTKVTELTAALTAADARLKETNARQEATNKDVAASAEQVKSLEAEIAETGRHASLRLKKPRRPPKRNWPTPAMPSRVGKMKSHSAIRWRPSRKISTPPAKSLPTDRPCSTKRINNWQRCNRP